MDRNAWLEHTLLGLREGLRWLCSFNHVHFSPLIRSLSSMAPALVMLHSRNAGEVAVGATPKVCTTLVGETVLQRYSTCETFKDYQVFESLTSQKSHKSNPNPHSSFLKLANSKVEWLKVTINQQIRKRQRRGRGELNAFAKRCFRKQQDLKRFV